LRDSNREWFRIVHYSLQDNHVHLIVEAESTASLASGMRGLAVRVARRMNRLLFRRGSFWADRWHGRALASPREVRNALLYVLQNRRKHAPVRTRCGSWGVPDLDVLSSAQWFNGSPHGCRMGFAASARHQCHLRPGYVESAGCAAGAFDSRKRPET